MLECWGNLVEGLDLPALASAFNVPPRVIVDPSGVGGFGTLQVWGGVLNNSKGSKAKNTWQDSGVSGLWRICD
jgi:hypothetical protein